MWLTKEMESWRCSDISLAERLFLLGLRWPHSYSKSSEVGRERVRLAHRSFYGVSWSAGGERDSKCVCTGVVVDEDARLRGCKHWGP